MENKTLLFGNVVKNKNTFFLPTPLATLIKAIPMFQRGTLCIRDTILSEPQGFRRVRPVFMFDGGVKIEGQEWNTFVRDRGIRVGDVLLMKTTHSHSYPYLINLRLIRLKVQPNNYDKPLVTPHLPNPNQSHDHDHDDFLDYVSFQIKPFLCMKILSEDDLRSDHFHQIEMPREIGEVIMEKAEDLIEILNEDDFGVLVYGKSYDIIETKLKLRADGEILFGKNWSQLVDTRGLKAGDALLFGVDLRRRGIITGSVRAKQDQGQDFVIPQFIIMVILSLTQLLHFVLSFFHSYVFELIKHILLYIS